MRTFTVPDSLQSCLKTLSDSEFAIEPSEDWILVS